MNKEKYLKQVVKHLRCTKVEKSKVIEDLNNDIDIALENGESMSEIITRLGSPEILAKELNENFACPQKKPWLKIMVIVAVILLALGALGIWVVKTITPKTQPLGTSKIYQQEAVENKVAEIIGYLNDSQYDMLYNSADEKMQGALSKETINNALQKLGTLGNYEKITSQNYVEVKNKDNVLVVGEVVALYQERSVTYTITLDEQMKLAGLYMK